MTAPSEVLDLCLLELALLLGVSIFCLHLDKDMLQGSKSIGFYGGQWDLGSGCDFKID